MQVSAQLDKRSRDVFDALVKHNILTSTLWYYKKYCYMNGGAGIEIKI